MVESSPLRVGEVLAAGDSLVTHVGGEIEIARVAARLDGPWLKCKGHPVAVGESPGIQAFLEIESHSLAICHGATAGIGQSREGGRAIVGIRFLGGLLVNVGDGHGIEFLGKRLGSMAQSVQESPQRKDKEEEPTPEEGTLAVLRFDIAALGKEYPQDHSAQGGQQVQPRWQMQSLLPENTRQQRDEQAYEGSAGS